MPILELDDLTLHYQLDGPDDAPVLLLSNPLGATTEIWMPQMELLAQRFRVLRYDPRGHGRSSVPRGPYSIAGMAGDALMLLDRLRIERAHFCGLSMGGQIGMWLAARHPGRIERLVLANTALRIGTAELWNERIAKLGAEGIESILPTVLNRWVTGDFQVNAPHQFEILRTMLRQMSAQGYAACAAGMRDNDVRADAPRVRAPTLVLSGRHDKTTRPVDAEVIAKVVPGARLVVLNSAHLSNREVAESFTRHVMTFLGEEVTAVRM